MSRTHVEHRLAEAVRALRSGRAVEAHDHLLAVLAADPGEPTALNIFGLNALRAGDARTAADHFERACKGDPGAAELWLNLASARRALGEAEAERATLERVLSLDQRNLLALIRLAQLHEEQGETSLATRRWSAVLTLAPAVDEPSPEFTALLAHAREYVERQRRHLADALDQALESDLANASTSERRRVRAAADVMLGRRPVFTNECHGLHYPFLPADEFFDRGHFPWLETLEASTAEIRRELQAILSEADPGLAPYVE